MSCHNFSFVATVTGSIDGSDKVSRVNNLINPRKQYWTLVARQGLDIMTKANCSLFHAKWTMWQSDNMLLLPHSMLHVSLVLMKRFIRFQKILLWGPFYVGFKMLVLLCCLWPYFLPVQNFVWVTVVSYEVLRFWILKTFDWPPHVSSILGFDRSEIVRDGQICLILILPKILLMIQTHSNLITPKSKSLVVWSGD